MNFWMLETRAAVLKFNILSITGSIGGPVSLRKQITYLGNVPPSGHSDLV
jgi:hypothetical protein